MKTFRVIVSMSERREYFVEAKNEQEAEENYWDFDYDNSTPLEEFVVEVEEIKEEEEENED